MKAQLSKLKSLDSSLAWEVGALNTYYLMTSADAPSEEFLYHAGNILARLSQYSPGKERMAALSLVRTAVPDGAWQVVANNFMKMYQGWADDDEKIRSYTPTKLAQALILLGGKSRLLDTLTESSGGAAALSLGQIKANALEQLRKAQGLFGSGQTGQGTSTQTTSTTATSSPVNPGHDDVLDF